MTNFESIDSLEISSLKPETSTNTFQETNAEGADSVASRLFTSSTQSKRASPKRLAARNTNMRTIRPQLSGAALDPNACARSGAKRRACWIKS